MVFPKIIYCLFYINIYFLLFLDDSMIIDDTLKIMNDFSNKLGITEVKNCIVKKKPPLPFHLLFF